MFSHKSSSHTLVVSALALKKAWDHLVRFNAADSKQYQVAVPSSETQLFLGLVFKTADSFGSQESKLMKLVSRKQECARMLSKMELFPQILR